MIRVNSRPTTRPGENDHNDSPDRDRVGSDTRDYSSKFIVFTSTRFE